MELGVSFMGTECLFCKMKRIQEKAGGMVARQCECTSYHSTVHLQMVPMVYFIIRVFYRNMQG